MQIRSHMEQPQVDKQASFLIPSPCLPLIQIFLSACRELVEVKLVSKDSMWNFDRSLFLRFLHTHLHVMLQGGLFLWVRGNESGREGFISLRTKFSPWCRGRQTLQCLIVQYNPSVMLAYYQDTEDIGAKPHPACQWWLCVLVNGNAVCIMRVC